MGFPLKSEETIPESESTDGPEQKPPERLSKKELARKMRREAYLRIKEFQKTDPRQIAMMEKLKQQRRDAYQKAKESWKITKAERKKVADEKDAEEKAAEGKKLLATLLPASGLKPGVKRRP